MVNNHFKWYIFDIILIHTILAFIIGMLLTVSQWFPIVLESGVRSLLRHIF